MSFLPQLRLPRIQIDWSGDTPHQRDDPELHHLYGSQDQSSVETPTATQKTSPPKATRQSDPKRPKRAFWVRLLSIRIGSAINLILWSVVIGLVMRFSGYGPFTPQQSGLERAGSMWSQFSQLAGMAFSIGWKPALTGAVVVLPLWLMWRFLPLPFRR